MGEGGAAVGVGLGIGLGVGLGLGMGVEGVVGAGVVVGRLCGEFVGRGEAVCWAPGLGAVMGLRGALNRLGLPPPIRKMMNIRAVPPSKSAASSENAMSGTLLLRGGA